MVLEHDRLGGSGVRLLIHGRLDRLAASRTVPVDDGLSQRLTPNGEEVADSERPAVAGLDVDDPGRVVGVEPADLRCRDPDERRHRTQLPADHHREVRVLVTGEDLARAARDVRSWSRGAGDGRRAARDRHREHGGEDDDPHVRVGELCIASSYRRAWGITVRNRGRKRRRAPAATITPR